MRQAPSRIEYSEWTCRWMNSAANGRLILGVGQDASALGDVVWFAPPRGAHLAARGRCRKGRFGRRNVVGSRRRAAHTLPRVGGAEKEASAAGTSLVRAAARRSLFGASGAEKRGRAADRACGQAPSRRGP